MQTNLLSPNAVSSATTTPPPLPKKRRGAVFKVVLGLVVVFALLAGIKVLQITTLISTSKKMVPPPTTVTSATVQQADWEPILRAVGTVNPVQGAMISAELAGTVAEVSFQSGAPVKKGDPLLKLDTSPEQAQLRSAEADAQLARNNFERAKDLAARKVISKAEFDAAQSTFQQKQAVVDNIRATMEKKQIRAPYDGVAGIRVVNPGQMVKAGDPLVSLQGLDRVYVDFTLPEQAVPDLKPGLDVKVRTDAVPDREFAGKLTAVNSSVDQATRTVSAQASLENPEHTLRAGMFARVDVLLPQKKPTRFVPATAVLYAPYGNSVFVIEKRKDEKSGKDSLVLRQQFVRTGETRGDFVEVTEGLKPGEQIAGTGVFKLRNGMNVVVDNKLAPKPELAPKPADS